MYIIETNFPATASTVWILGRYFHKQSHTGNRIPGNSPFYIGRKHTSELISRFFLSIDMLVTTSFQYTVCIDCLIFRVENSTDGDPSSGRGGGRSLGTTEPFREALWYGRLSLPIDLHLPLYSHTLLS